MKEFLAFFPKHVYRYIDQTGAERPPVSSNVVRDDLNLAGYEAYFTVNGFYNAPDAKKDQCTNINAFFADIDGRKDSDELEGIKKRLDPTYIMETMNGYHLYWVLSEPVNRSEITQEEWAEIVKAWEVIEQTIVKTLNADKAVKDLPRILRQLNTFYWKKSGDKYKSGTEGVFKIKQLYHNPTSLYNFEQVAVAFPTLAEEVSIFVPENKLRRTQAETQSFFDCVNSQYPIEERDSFKALISGEAGTVAEHERNTSLMVTSNLMKQAKWSHEKAMSHFNKIGWHGLSANEIANTVKSSYDKGYTYSYKHEVIERNMSDIERVKMQEVYTHVAKGRKEIDKTRYATYEKEILLKHPYLRKVENDIIFNYVDGVYKMMTDQDISTIILNGLYEDMLWGFRTKKHVADKVACLLSAIPNLVITEDHGRIVNVKNGLLDLHTKILKPHTPNFVSLVQYQVVYDPLATCPTWMQCLDEWLAGNEKEKKHELLQQFSGYCLSSSTQYQKALFLIGDGGSGKSTFADTISMVIGDNATSHIDLEGLYGQYGFKGLIGKRLNIIEEVRGNYYESNKLKKLISGERVTIDMKYKDQFTFRPQAKFVFAVNLMPRVDDTSTATERRVCAVMFKNSFKDNPNTQLRSDFGLLAKELQGIFNWMMAGADMLRDKGNFTITEEQTELLAEYREENSSVEGFIKECLSFVKDEFIESTEMYSEYAKWCKSDGGRKQKSKFSFVKEMKTDKRFSFVPRPKSNGDAESKFTGVKFAPQWKAQGNVFKNYDF
jgi:putative DNA primase/helicase